MQTKTISMLLNGDQSANVAQSLANLRETLAFLRGNELANTNVAYMHELSDEPDTRYIAHLHAQAAEYKAQQVLLNEVKDHLEVLMGSVFIAESADTFNVEVGA